MFKVQHMFLAPAQRTRRMGWRRSCACYAARHRPIYDEHLRRMMVLTRALFVLIPITYGVLPLTAAAAARPPITKIANFVVKTDNLEEARRFYSGVLGYDEVFRHQRTISGTAELLVFKVNDH